MTRREIELGGGLKLSREVLQWRFTRSGGPGGQNVNKLSTRATLEVPLSAMKAVLPEYAYRKLLDTAGQYLAGDSIAISSDRSRSQLTNRRLCIEKFQVLVAEALKRRRNRRPTKPSRSAIERRLSVKKKRGRLKQNRQKPGQQE